MPESGGELAWINVASEPRTSRCRSWGWGRVARQRSFRQLRGRRGRSSARRRIQTGLSVIDYLDDRELIAWCGEQGIAVTIYEPLANGILTDAPYEQVRQNWVGTEWEDSSFFRRMFSAESVKPVQQVVDGL